MKVRVLWLYSYLRDLFLRFSTVILLLYKPHPRALVEHFGPNASQARVYF